MQSIFKCMDLNEDFKGTFPDFFRGYPKFNSTSGPSSNSFFSGFKGPPKFNGTSGPSSNSFFQGLRVPSYPSVISALSNTGNSTLLDHCTQLTKGIPLIFKLCTNFSYKVQCIQNFIFFTNGKNGLNCIPRIP